MRISLDTVIDTQSWYKVQLLNGYSRTRRMGIYESFWSRLDSRKSFTLTIRWNLAILVKSYLESSIFYTPSIRDEWNCRKSSAQKKKKGRSAVLLQSGLDVKWWADSMECCCFLRNVQDFLTAGKTRYVRRFEELRAMATGSASPRHAVPQTWVLKPDSEHELQARGPVSGRGCLRHQRGQSSQWQVFPGGLEFKQWELLGTLFPDFNFVRKSLARGDPKRGQREEEEGSTDSTQLMPGMWSSRQ